MNKVDVKLVVVYWIDSYDNGVGWKSIDEIPDDMCTCVSSGFIIMETDDKIVLAASISDAYGKEVYIDVVSNIIHIPKVCIKELIYVGEGVIKFELLTNNK